MFNTAHDIYKIDGEVSKTFMSGETSEISQFFELEWFQWIKFCDENAPLSDDMPKLDHYLGLSIDISPAMTAKKSYTEWTHNPQINMQTNGPR